MVLMIDTTESHIGNAVLREIEKCNLQNYELIDTTDMNISHCIGCNYCWLKTRYEHQADFGIIYHGEAENAYLNHWSDRVALNFGSKSLGAYEDKQLKEAVACMC